MEGLDHQLKEIERRLQVAGEELGEGESERQSIQGEWARLKNEPLFGKELLRIQRSLASAEHEVGESAQRVATLWKRDRSLRARVSARSQRLDENIRILNKQAEVLSPFNGRISRIERRAANDGVLYSVFYR